MQTAAEVFQMVFSHMASDERQKLYSLMKNSLYPNHEEPFEAIIQELRDA